jgi:transposase
MMPGDDVLTMPAAARVEVFTGSARRRRWSAEDKARLVAESHATSVGEVSDRYGICKTQLFTWRREARRSAVAEVRFAPVVVEGEPADHPETEGGLIEVEFEASRVRIGRGADVGMALAVIGALRGKR